MLRRNARTIALFLIVALIAAGCATLEEGSAPAPTSVETLEYYPFQVKGYQESYPHRTMRVLTPVDDRNYRDAQTPDHSPLGKDPAVGIVTAQDGAILQKLYSEPLPLIVQKAIAQSAQEAGMTAQASPETEYKPGSRLPEEYVLQSKITRCWVKKHRGLNRYSKVVWTTAADFSLEVTVYKPPFSAPFWQGDSSASYNDPPVGSFGLGPEDEAGIYDEPGQVLSVALTRAVAGIFEKNDFRSLLLEDQVHPR